MDLRVPQFDQAQQLRRLVTKQEVAESHVPEDVPVAGSPRIVVVSGGKGGVGTTTLAVNVAAALARRGKRVVVVDLDLRRADVARMCGIQTQASLADVLASTRSIQEALEAGPAGMHILSGCRPEGETLAFRQDIVEQLIQKLRGVGRVAEYVIVDAGKGATQLARSFWRAASSVLMVTTSDAVAIMDSYATIKALLDPRRHPRLQVVVNQVSQETQAQEVYQRLTQSCRRFLRCNAEWAGFVPLDKSLADGALPSRPAIMQSPTTPASRAWERLAATLMIPAMTEQELEAA